MSPLFGGKQDSQDGAAAMNAELERSVRFRCRSWQPR